MCGCGQMTGIAKRSHPESGQACGHHVRYVHGHNTRRAFDPWHEEDRGHDTPCWIWELSENGGGYGRLSLNGQGEPAHRAIYKRFRGDIPDGLYLDHLCRVPACVNPDHLEPVTLQVNTQRGASAKLTPDDVRKIWKLRFEDGLSYRAIAKRFPVCHQNVARICLGQAWFNVEAA